MALTLYYHPFSSYSWKALIPLYEAGTPFIARKIDDPQAMAELLARWPLGRFPVLVEETSGLTLPEASVIVEYLDEHHPAPSQMLPTRSDVRLEVRLLDRFFDLYIHAAVQKITGDRLRPPEERDAWGLNQAHALLATCYAWLETRLADRRWAVGDDFSLADCAAAPALFYADWVQPIDAVFPRVSGYRARLLARPSVMRAVDGARPYRGLFPGGAPDRD